MSESFSSVTQIPTEEFMWNEKTFLSSGSYGEVYKVKWTKSDKIIAAKHFRGSDARVSRELENEVKMLKRVNHPNIIQLIGITKDSESKPYLVMEYADCGSLHQYIHDERTQLKIMSSLELHNLMSLALHNLMLQLAKGVAYLHDMEPKVIHRDLKPSNLLLTNDYRTLKICDFGTVRVLASRMTAEARGTTCYRAPEVSITQGRYTEKCDVYSFGIILWEVFSGKRPYYDMENNTDAAVSHAVINNNARPSLEDVKQIMNRENYIALMTKCWDKDPTKRPTMEAVQGYLENLEALEDPKFKTRKFEGCLSNKLLVFTTIFGTIVLFTAVKVSLAGQP